jgi:hypothetical protein
MSGNFVRVERLKPLCHQGFCASLGLQRSRVLFGLLEGQKSERSGDRSESVRPRQVSWDYRLADRAG